MLDSLQLIASNAYMHTGLMLVVSVSEWEKPADGSSAMQAEVVVQVREEVPPPPPTVPSTTPEDRQTPPVTVHGNGTPPFPVEGMVILDAKVTKRFQIILYKHHKFVHCISIQIMTDPIISISVVSL